MRPFFWRIVACVVPVLLGLVIVGMAVNQFMQGQGGFKLGVDLVGGTILVYEVDHSKETKLKDDRQRKLGEELAASLKRRIDPADLYSVTIRPIAGDERVEIILPTGGKLQATKAEEAWKDIINQAKTKFGVPDAAVTAQRGHTDKLVEELVQAVEAKRQGGAEAAGNAEGPAPTREEIGQYVAEEYRKREKNFLTGEDVQRIKELISQVGSLEFRILANNRNDKEAQDAARAQITPANPEEREKVKADLLSLAYAGKPPPPPTAADGSPYFNTNLGKFSYSWVELGRSERQQMGLDNATEENVAKIPELLKRQKDGPKLTKDEEKTLRHAIDWQAAAEARAKGEAVPFPPDSRDLLLYSRKAENPRLSAKDKGKKYEYFFLTRDTQKGKEVTGEHLVKAQSGTDENRQLSVHFGFDNTGADLFRELTYANRPMGEGGYQSRLAIVLDGQIMSAPALISKTGIGAEGQITGSFSPVEVDRLVSILRAGALPATLKPQPVSENTMGATLGEDTIRSGTWSVLIAFVAVLLFMLLYYRFSGLVACVALFANLILTVAFMVLVSATFTLPGLAGLVLMLGMAVDANVLIYERLREERERGASLALAIRNGYDRAFPTIIDTHLSSIFTAIVLYVVGNDQLKGFGISLTVGLVISLFTSLYMTRLMFDIGLARGWLRDLNMLSFRKLPGVRWLLQRDINFMAIRYQFFTATAILTILGAALFIGRGASGLNIDFTGGTAYGGQLSEPLSLGGAGGLRDLLSESRQKQVLAIDPGGVRRLDDAGRVYEITYKDGSKLPRVELKEPATEEQVRERAQGLPDLSVEQIFLSSGEGTDPNDRSKSTYFNVRTPEMERALVQASITKLLEGKLKTLDLKTEGDNPYQIDTDKRTALLHFVDQKTGEPAFASPTQVTGLLQESLKANGLEGHANQFALIGLGTDRDGRFQEMELKLTGTEAVDRGKLEAALGDLKTHFASQPQPERLENFDPQLAADMQTRALQAILASWGVILLYLWFRFGNWTFGLAAVVCLIHDLFFTLGAIAACHYVHEYAPALATVLGLQDFKIDLPAVAALLTLVGYSVNDTIVVFDRIREVRGKNPNLTPQMINDSVNQTLSRTILTALTVWLVVIVLYIWGGAGVHLFAFVMVVGVIVGTYSSIYIASPLLLIFGEGSKGAAARERAPEPAAAE